MLETLTLPCPEPAPNRRKWTRDECRRLVEIGFLVGRYELIDGEVISKMGQLPPHAYVIQMLTKWLVAVFGGDFVRLQLPVDVAQVDAQINEPEPDGTVMALPATAFLDHIPLPSETRLIIEVVDSSLRFDLTAKAALYARAGFPEYWVIDVVGRRIVAHRDPTPRGYRALITFDSSQEIAPLCDADASIRVTDLLPPLPDNRG